MSKQALQLLTEWFETNQKALMFLHVADVKPLDGYQLYLTFNDGVIKLTDLENELYGEVFEPLKDRALFR